MRCASALFVAAMAAYTAMAAPSTSSFTPANGATSVHPLATVAVTFDTAVDAGHAKLIRLHRKDSGHVLSTVAAASSWVTIDGATATVAFPVSHVLSGEVYVTIEAGAFVSTADESPFAGISDKSWSFAFQGEPTRLLSASAPPPRRASCAMPAAWLLAWRLLWPRAPCEASAGVRWRQAAKIEWRRVAAGGPGEAQLGRALRPPLRVALRTGCACWACLPPSHGLGGAPLPTRASPHRPVEGPSVPSAEQLRPRASSRDSFDFRSVCR